MQRKKSRLSLRLKLLGMMLGTCTVIGLTTVFLFERSYTTTEQEKLNVFRIYAQGISESIAAQFYERYSDVQAFAINDVMFGDSVDAITDKLNQYIALYGIYDLILFVDTNGRLLAVNNKGPGGQSLQVESLSRMNYANEPWFQAAMRGQFTDDRSKGFTGTFVEDAQIDKFATAAYGREMYG